MESKRHIQLGVPIVITSTIVATTIFSTLSSNPDIEWKIITGFLSISAAVLASLQTFFKHSELSERHRIAGAEYSSISRNLELFMLKFDDMDRGDLIKELEDLIEEINNLDTISPDPPDIVYNRAVKEQNTNED
ncbi:DUF4231 domain-containing protein [Maribacter polysiphoniae]|uniref:DUF4231 domain-containing protein n=2 Tax=Maribacter polysiphoniae TaxID=429344 RepID=A0ABR7W1C1_9FLAO|nr:DUF4231 domain-containing protein [Maribacter polysiphoniae]